MTEDEAKTKWCCGPAPHNTGRPEKDDYAEGDEIIMVCSGSACMAWRWLPQGEQTRGQSYAHPDEPDPPWQGFCGLSGKP